MVTAPHLPDMLYKGNRELAANDPSIMAIGIHELEQQDLDTEVIEDGKDTAEAVF